MTHPDLYLQFQVRRTLRGFKKKTITLKFGEDLSGTNVILVSKQLAAAPNGSVPQNICCLGKFLLAGSFGKNMWLEGKGCWEIEI